MPPWVAAVVGAIKNVPWKKVFAVATWLYTTAKSRLEKNLTKKEREELTKILAKAKGRPSNLTPRERTRLRWLVYKAVVGRFPS